MKPLSASRTAGVCFLIVLTTGLVFWLADHAGAQVARRTYTDTIEVQNLNIEVVASGCWTLSPSSF